MNEMPFIVYVCARINSPLFGIGNISDRASTIYHTIFTHTHTLTITHPSRVSIKLFLRARANSLFISTKIKSYAKEEKLMAIVEIVVEGAQFEL